MTEKKEIIDYLRNVQKSSEIRSKIHGANSWVIIAAISIIFSTLIDGDIEVIIDHFFLITKTACIIYLLIEIIPINTSIINTETTRYLPSSIDDDENKYINFLKNLLFIVPWYYYIKKYGFTISLNNIFFAALTISFLFKTTVDTYFFISNEKPRIPKPEFLPSKKIISIIFFIFLCFFIFCLIENLIEFKSKFSTLKRDQYKQIFYAIALNLLLIFIIDRYSRLKSITWTYQLETDLILNNITQQAALSLIEKKQLGEKFSNFLDDYMQAIDSKIILAEEGLNDALAKLEEIKNIPNECKKERDNRLIILLTPLRKNIKNIEEDLISILNYLKKIKNNYILINKNISAEAVSAAIQKVSPYTDKFKDIQTKLNQITAENSIEFKS